MILSEPIKTEKEEVDDSDILENNSVLKVMLEHYVNYTVKPGTKRIETPEITVNIQ